MLCSTLPSLSEYFETSTIFHWEVNYQKLKFYFKNLNKKNFNKNSYLSHNLSCSEIVRNKILNCCQSNKSLFALLTYCLHYYLQRTRKNNSKLVWFRQKKKRKRYQPVSLAIKDKAIGVGGLGFNSRAYQIGYIYAHVKFENIPILWFIVNLSMSQIKQMIMTSNIELSCRKSVSFLNRLNWTSGQGNCC